MNEWMQSFGAYGNGNSKSGGFWGVIAQKAKSILDDDKPTPQHDTMPQTQTLKSHSFNTFSGPSAAQVIIMYNLALVVIYDAGRYDIMLPKITWSIKLRLLILESIYVCHLLFQLGWN